MGFGNWDNRKDVVDNNEKIEQITTEKKETNEIPLENLTSNFFTSFPGFFVSFAIPS